MFNSQFFSDFSIDQVSDFDDFDQVHRAKINQEFVEVVENQEYDESNSLSSEINGTTK